MTTISDDDNNFVSEEALRTQNFFHFINLVAFPKMNELIFRRRMFCTSWTWRKRALNHILKYLKDGRQFGNEANEIMLSLKRDHLILFGKSDELDQLMSDETNFLPQNQNHENHEKYALITHLSRLYQMDSLSDQEEKLLINSQKSINKIKKVDSSWLSYQMNNPKDERETWGPEFLAPNEKSADEFINFVSKWTEDPTGVTNGQNVGLFALGYWPPDPMLMLQKNIDEESKLVIGILNAMETNDYINSSDQTKQPNESSSNSENVTTDEL
jgi:hypothetical protein